MRHSVIGHFKRSRAFFLFFGICVDLLVYWPLIIIITIESIGSVAKACRHGALGPGFESQVPQNIYLFFSSHDLMQRYTRHSTIGLNHPGARCLQAAIQWLRVDDHHVSSQHVLQRIQKVNAGLGLMGLESASKPPFWAQNPPLVHPFFFYFIFSIFIY